MTTDGYHAIVFNHTSPFDYTVKDDANMISFCNVLDAFTNHASYSDASVTVDFSAKESTKTVAWLCGHGHMDAYGVPGGWCATRDRDASAAPVQNTHAFAVVMCTISNYMYDDERVVSAGGHDVGVILKRRWGELSMFAFDALVYQKDLGKLTLVRFGAHATSYQVDANGNREIIL